MLCALFAPWCCGAAPQPTLLPLRVQWMSIPLNPVRALYFIHRCGQLKRLVERLLRRPGLRQNSGQPSPRPGLRERVGPADWFTRRKRSTTGAVANLVLENLTHGPGPAVVQLRPGGMLCWLPSYFSFPNIFDVQFLCGVPGQPQKLGQGIFVSTFGWKLAFPNFFEILGFFAWTKTSSPMFGTPECGFGLILVAFLDRFDAISASQHLASKWCKFWNFQKFRIWPSDLIQRRARAIKTWKNMVGLPI